MKRKAIQTGPEQLPGKSQAHGIALGSLSMAALVLLATSAASGAPRCGDIFKRSEDQIWKAIQKEIRPEEAKLDYHNNLSYLREMARTTAVGSMKSEFSNKFETRFYYSATGQPGRDGRIPMVDPKSKAVYVFVHGSGTMKSSGRNFFGLMNILGQAGYSSVSFDLPYHMEGPRRPSLNNSREFMKWFEGIVSEIRQQAGEKPIYLVGHSFGPDVIAEYLYHNPFAIQGALLASPAGFNSVLSKWYDQKTSKMKFGGNVAENTMAGLWAGQVVRDFQWNKTNGSGDPTRVNPDLQVRVLTGDREEYVPAPLGPKGLPAGKNTYDLGKAIREHLSNAIVSKEEGVGHYLFEHKDAKGRGVFLREVLALNGVDSLRINELIRSHAENTQRDLVDLLHFNFASDRIFAAWVRETFGERAFRTAVERRDEHFMKALHGRYAVDREARLAKIAQEILEFADRNQDFAQKFEKTLSVMRKERSKTVNTVLFAAYLEYIDRSVAD